MDQGGGIRVSEPCLLRSSLYWLVPGCSPVFLQLYQPLWVITSTTVFHPTDFVRKISEWLLLHIW